MAECPSCGAPVKGGDWTCGACGAPIVAASTAPTEGAGGYVVASRDQAQPSAGVTQPAHGSSGVLKAVLVLGVVAVLAIVLVWFFALRAPATTGEEFIGNWTASTSRGIASVDVSRQGQAFSVTLTGNDQSQSVTVPAHLDGEQLVITMDDFSQIAGAGQADALKAALAAMAGEFKLIFSSVEADRLDLRIVGTAANGDDFDETIPLTGGAAPAT